MDDCLLSVSLHSLPSVHLFLCLHFPGGASGKKNLPANAGDIGNMGSIPGLGRSPGGGHGHPLQYSCLENPMDPHPMEELGGLQSIGSHRVGHN